MTDDDQAQLRDLLDRFKSGWEKQDAGQVLSTISWRDDTVIYGTDLAEHWVGFDSLVEPFKAMAESIEGPVYEWEEGEPRIRVWGDAAWACGTLKVTLKEQAAVDEIAMRSSFVLEKGEDGWKISHAHFSIGQDEAVVAYGED